MITIKNEQEIDAMRESGKILSLILDTLVEKVTSGMETREIDRLARQEIKAMGVKPVLVGYMGYPAAICVSVNDEVVHGIPGRYVLRAGDLVGLDLCVGYKGMITDSARTIAVDGTDDKGRLRLLKATEESLYCGIDEVRHGAHVGDISAAVEKRLRADKLGVFVDLVGHGVGFSVHELPEIPNVGTRGSGPTLKAGMTIAIEPMASLGTKDLYVDQDGWTIKTRDGQPTAHFEHTVLVTGDGFEILT